MSRAASAPWARFRRQSAISDPGAHARRLAAASIDPFDLVEDLGRTVLNFVTDRGLVEGALFAQRLPQIDLRTIEAMLDALFAISDAPLNTRRRPEQRIVGNCRDTALLCAATLRTHGVPARVRYGFAPHLYRAGARLHDHAVTEFFEAGCWKTLDCRMHADVIALHGIPLRPGELLPDGLFVPALAAWRDGRLGVRDFAAFANGEGHARGMSLVARFAYLDIASLNGFEPLLWDAWGAALYRQPGAAIDDEEELEALDACAACDPGDEDGCERLAAAYAASDVLRVTATVTSFSPCAGQRRWRAAPHSHP